MNHYMRVYAEINLDAIKHNIAEIRKKVGNTTKIMLVIKADGYGHGSVAVAQAMQEQVEAFCVATIEEGILLRKRGITKSILILGYTAKEQYPQLMQYNLSQTIFEYEMAEAISRIAVAMNKEALIHIAVETGMNRIGFYDDEKSVAIIKEIQKLPMVQMEGIFTHFACADEKDKTSACHQMKRYEAFVSRLEEEGIFIPIKHVANSAAIIDLDMAKMNMVRSGIITYGLYPSNEVKKEVLKLKPAMELKSHVVYVKTVGAGEGVSYGSTYVTEKETKIATISIGYADGYPRALSSKGRVLIRGQYAPIIGRVCMDQMMVDVTHIHGVQGGDIVTLVGKDGENAITAEEIAGYMNTINYEFICGLGRRVPRVYLENGEVIKVADYLTD